MNETVPTRHSKVSVTIRLLSVLHTSEVARHSIGLSTVVPMQIRKSKYPDSIHRQIVLHHYGVGVVSSRSEMIQTRRYTTRAIRMTLMAYRPLMRDTSLSQDFLISPSDHLSPLMIYSSSNLSSSMISDDIRVRFLSLHLSPLQNKKSYYLYHTQ